MPLFGVDPFYACPTCGVEHGLEPRLRSLEDKLSKAERERDEARTSLRMANDNSLSLLVKLDAAARYEAALTKLSCMHDLPGRAPCRCDWCATVRVALSPEPEAK